MAQVSVWRVKFHVGAGGSNQYNTFIGVSGGTRKDGQNVTTAAAIATALNTNLLAIIKEAGNTTLTAGPSGVITVDAYEPAPVPDCWT